MGELLKVFVGSVELYGPVLKILTLFQIKIRPFRDLASNRCTQFENLLRTSRGFKMLYNLALTRGMIRPKL